MSTTSERPARTGHPRVEGPDKVTGRARYAVEYPVEASAAGEVAHVWPVQATIAKGEVLDVDASAVRDLPGVLSVLWHETAPRLRSVPDPGLLLFQSPGVAYRGQFVAAVVAETLEQARAAADALPVRYRQEDHRVVLDADDPTRYRPDTINPNYETDTTDGDVEAALAAAPVTVDHVYSTPALHNNPMEPHATTAHWQVADDGGEHLLVHDSSQGSTAVADTLTRLFGLEDGAVRVVNTHVGGGFGSKGTPRPNVVLAALAAHVLGRPVRLALAREHLFGVVGYRTPTIQRVRLAADREGLLQAITHDVVEQTSTVREFAEQTAVATRSLYASRTRSTSHRLVRLDVPTPSWMRAPGECPGMFALESAMDELALAAGLDPIELRVRNEPDVEPSTGRPFSSRHLVECLREGAERFGWAGRDPRPGTRRDGRWLVGTGVASSTYPTYAAPARATAGVGPDGRYRVRVNATDIGTGARTALLLVAAEALGVSPHEVEVQLGDSSLPRAGVAGGSMGTRSWGWAVAEACRTLRQDLGGLRPEDLSADGLEAAADTAGALKRQERVARHAYGAQFAEVGVDVDTAEIRVRRLLGVFAAGRIVNPTTARSQLLGGMTMGLGMALLEEGRLDAEFGDYANHDLAGYHVATCADTPGLEAYWIDEDDPHLGPVGAKGIGEIGIVGTAAAIANAVHHATGARVRDLPITLDKLLDKIPEPT